MLVEATGRIGVNVWNNMDGEAKASLTLYVQHVQLHGKNVKHETATAVNSEPIDTAEVDLPF
ncbi:hypothetical protein [Niabella ginsengisoli]|uniref:Single-stranded DNA-binding protein n=1 Tax=Niabella ginsengisoli TaxID=522298 RepID=A0ABS9SI32_9BACT|nr:hypothetical protein [Niabella ginsengisoli]MCH5597995.1 hypothetical protein [Niabella ginsengisoli]